LKLLLIRFSSIGDIVLTTPVARCLKRQLGAEIHYLTKRAFQDILTSNPYIDKVHAIDKRATEALPALRAERFDFVVDLHHNFRSWRVKTSLGAPHRAFRKLNCEKWLLVNFKIDRLPPVHIVDRYLDTVRHLGVVNDGQGLDYFIPPAEEVNPADFFPPEALEAAIHSNGFAYIAFAIGAAHATKRLPSDKILEFCRALPLPAVLLGGPGEADLGTAIAAAAGPKIVNACGKLSLNQSASMSRQATAVIAHDTGLMHIAAAFQKPIISIWGNTVPSFGMYPYYGVHKDRNFSLQVENLACRPCSKIGGARCPRGHFRCMRDQRAQDLLEGLSKTIHSDRAMR
jgi:ADP-heptose:LPS heptosyltransferase